MAREATFTFIPAHQVDRIHEGGEWTVTIMTKPAKAMSFPSKHPETISLIGKYLNFYVDQSKNTIAWKVFAKGDLADLTNAMPVRQHEFKTGNSISSSVKVSITKALNALKFEEGKSYKKLIVKKYRPQGMLNDGKDYYYVKIPLKGEKDDE